MFLFHHLQGKSISRPKIVGMGRRSDLLLQQKMITVFSRNINHRSLKGDKSIFDILRFKLPDLQSAIVQLLPELVLRIRSWM